MTTSWPSMAMRPLARIEDRRLQEVERADEGGDEPRAPENCRSRTACADLLHVALAHHHDAVGHGQGLLLVVRDHDRGQAELALQVADLDADFVPELGVEIGERLVEQQDVRLHGQRAGERDALLLAAGELARIACSSRPVSLTRRRLRRRAAAIGRRDLAHLQAEADVLGDGHVREQRVGLEDQAAIALPGRQAVTSRSPMVIRAGARRIEAGDHAQRRGLAAAGGAEEGRGTRRGRSARST
jgi:hypothetical protein